MTPVTMRVDDVPVPVKGSDGRYHVVYELELTNATSERVTIDHLNVLGARNGKIVAALDATQLGQRLVVRDTAATPGSLGAAQVGLVYVHLVFDSKAAIPRALDHVLSVVLKSQPIAGDGCCDSVRHVRATLAVNGQLFTAQRFAIDWEQLDAQDRIYVGDPNDPMSYVIYGKTAYAVADAQVVAAVDGMPVTPPGAIPEGLTLEQADGNHVVLDLGDDRYALYAQFKPWSVRVYQGEYVRRGQVLGLVGTSGNSSEPHLHFHVTDGPSPLASNGLPYRFRRFYSIRRGISPAAFDEAIVERSTDRDRAGGGPGAARAGAAARPFDR